MLFISPQKLFSFSRYLTFYLDLHFAIEEKRLDKKTKINSKIYGVTTWLKNNCKTHIDQYLKK